MSKPIKIFDNGSSLEYDQGMFDGWYVYLKTPDVLVMHQKTLIVFNN